MSECYDAMAREWLEKTDLYDHDPTPGPDGEPNEPYGDRDSRSLSALLARVAADERERLAGIVGKMAEKARLAQMIQNAMLGEKDLPPKDELALKGITHAISSTLHEVAAAIRKEPA